MLQRSRSSEQVPELNCSMAYEEQEEVNNILFLEVPRDELVYVMQDSSFAEASKQKIQKNSPR